MRSNQDTTATADGAADIVAADPGAVQAGAEAQGIDQGDIAGAMKEAQAAQEANAANTVAARDYVTPDATYAAGVPGANVNVAAPADAPVVSTYEDALEAGYFGIAPGHANTDKLSVAAVTARDAKLGLTGRSQLRGAVVNKAEGSPDAAKSKTS